MTNGLGPYLAMRDSGAEWLGDMPTHWGCRRLKTLCEMQSGEAITAESIGEMGQYPVYGGNGLRGFSSMYTHDGSHVLIGRQGALCGNVHRAHGRFWASEHAVVATLYGDHFLEWFASLLQAMNLNQYSIAAAQPGLSVDRVLNLWAPVPPQCEQAAIARFLDHMDYRIQKYIRGKEKLIALLDEYKQALIHQAVTGQIDVRTGKPYKEYKESGVEGLGRVPGHWEVNRLRRLVVGKLAYGANVAAEHDNPAWPRYLRITDFSKDGKLRQDTFRSVPPEIANKYLLDPGDVLLARSGATVGKAFLVDKDAGPACHAGYLIRARLNRSILHPNLFFAFTQSAAFAMWKSSSFIVATIENISAEKYADLPVPVPPRSEQRSLLEFIGESIAKIDRAVEFSTREIALVKEHRTRFIADVVTGKLDVREAVANLPDSDRIGDEDLGNSLNEISSPSLDEKSAVA